MSHQQKSYSYLYLTLTGDGDAHQLVRDYFLTNVSAWNPGDVEAGRYQFQQMCVRMEGEQEEGLYWHEAVARFLEGRAQRQLMLVPPEFARTLHLVSHGVGYQSHGFHLSTSNISQLARIQAGFHYHGYLQADDGHDYPNAVSLAAEDQDADTREHAGLFIESRGHTLDELAQLTGLPPDNERSRSRGDIQFKLQPVVEGQPVRRLSTSLMIVDSGVAKGEPLAMHIEAVLARLAASRARITPLLLDYRVSLGLTGTGTLRMPHELVLSSAQIEQLAQFRCMVDMDLYAQS